MDKSDIHRYCSSRTCCTCVSVEHVSRLQTGAHHGAQTSTSHSPLAVRWSKLLSVSTCILVAAGGIVDTTVTTAKAANLTALYILYMQIKSSIVAAAESSKSQGISLLTLLISNEPSKLKEASVSQVHSP